jgi:hypothetical protein
LLSLSWHRAATGEAFQSRWIMSIIVITVTAARAHEMLWFWPGAD